MVAILDYGVGNLKSVNNMFKKAGVESIITSDIEVIKNAKKYLLPGVGSFDYGINSLKNANFFKSLEHEVLKNEKPILGICLGMQLLTNMSEEGNERGLGWIDAETKKFDFSDSSLPVPHMGWNHVVPKMDNGLFSGLDDDSRFYFVHSYHVVCKNPLNILATTVYGKNFTSSIHNNHIMGVQFHPEKSHKYGMQLLKNYGEI